MYTRIGQLYFSFLFICVFINISFSPVSVSGQGILTESERNALDKFRGMVGDILTKDFQKLDSYLIRWLRAKNFDVGAAVDFYRKNAKWRKENKIDSIFNETIFVFDPPAFTNNAFDVEGGPVIAFTPTVVDMRQLILSGNGDKLVRYWDQILEGSEHRLEIISKKTDGKIYQGISLMDLNRFNIRQHACLGCIRVFLDWTRHYENYHPEMAKHIIWINAPRAFVPIAELVRPLQSLGSQKALKIFTANRNEWSAYLHKLISPDQLSIQFGGTRPN